MEYTLSIIKPCAVQKNVTGRINALLEMSDLKIVAQKMIRIPKEVARDFYIEHIAAPFFNDLIKYMTSGPVIVQVLKGVDAVTTNRNVMGSTNPANAAVGTIRKLFGENIERNAVHGSDSVQSAKREIAQFFTKDEIME